jgi:hypothetical protein
VSGLSGSDQTPDDAGSYILEISELSGKLLSSHTVEVSG